jgi:UDP-glucose 4-epimerase
MKKAIVTGGAGFIGSHVAAHLLRQGVEVLVIDDLSGGFEENVPEDASFLKASINSDLVDVFQKFRPDFVYHLAAYAAEGLSHHIPSFNYENNVLGTINVLNAAYKAGAKHFVFTSSIAAYGHPHTDEPFDEDTPCVPCDPYGTAKLACEYHIKAFRDYFGGIDYTIFRPHNVFGPHQNIADPYRNVVGIFMARAMKQQPMPVFGDGSQTRSFSYINVVAESIASAPFVAEAKNEVFNIGGDEPMSVKVLAEKISAIFGVEARIEWMPTRKEVAHAHCRHDKAKRVFAKFYDQAVDIEQGLRLMAETVKGKSIPPATECPSDIEIFDNLPPSWATRLQTQQHA